jgi:cell wall-associated NlpC family hydrolase
VSTTAPHATHTVPRPPRLRAAALPLALLLALLAGCAPFQRGPPGEGPGAASAPTPGVAVLRVAESRIGAPYRYGGAGPDAFDCSGLVAYAHGQVGVAVPRTAAQQFAAATPIARGDLQPGDLVFFRLAGREVSHVGIYAGGDRFVHAPQSGGHVRVASLAEDVFRRGWAGGGRLLP